MVWRNTFMTWTFELKTKFKDNADPLSSDTIWVWYEVDCGNTKVKIYGRDKQVCYDFNLES